jgi:hypothetical protein
LPDVAEAGEGSRATPVRHLLADRTPCRVAGRRRVRGGVLRRASQSYGGSCGGSKQAGAANDKSSGKDAVAWRSGEDAVA